MLPLDFDLCRKAQESLKFFKPFENKAVKLQDNAAKTLAETVQKNDNGTVGSVGKRYGVVG